LNRPVLWILQHRSQPSFASAILLCQEFPPLKPDLVQSKFPSQKWPKILFDFESCPIVHIVLRQFVYRRFVQCWPKITYLLNLFALLSLYRTIDKR
jgi:hypothetical protein